MPGLSVKKSGAWKTVNTSKNSPPYSWRKVGGVWKPMKGIYYKVGGAWKEVYLEMPDNYLVTNANATLGSSNTALAWTAPVSTSITTVRIVRKLNAKPANETDGTILADLARTATTYTDTGVTTLSPLGTYWYAWFSSLGGVWQTPVYDSVEVSDITAPGLPTVNSAKAIAGKSKVVFTNPSDSDFSHTIVRYSTSGYPTTSSGTLVGNYSTAGKQHTISLSGPGSMVTVSYHNGEKSGSYLSRSGNSYHYFSLFSVDLRGNTSAARQTSVYFLRSPITVNATGNQSWGSSYGWETSYTRIRQANYGSSNEYRGFWYYNTTRAWTDIGTRTATGFVWMCRTTGSNGSNVNVPIRMYGHDYTAGGGGYTLGTYYGDLSGPGIDFDNPRYCILPSGLTADLCDNTWNGIACYGDQDSQCYIGGDDYGSSDGNITIYHYDYAS